jgi:hypothetical protein
VGADWLVNGLLTNANSGVDIRRRSNGTTRNYIALATPGLLPRIIERDQIILAAALIARASVERFGESVLDDGAGLDDLWTNAMIVSALLRQHPTTELEKIIELDCYLHTAGVAHLFEQTAQARLSQRYGVFNR